MITFFTAIGTYKFGTNERGQNAPYIQSLGKLHAISIPEFVIWSHLLWDILTYEELKEKYAAQLKKVNAPVPDFDELIEMLLARKLIARGQAYTGSDALYSMLSEAFVLPHKPSLFKHRSGLSACLNDAREYLMNLFPNKHESAASYESRVFALIKQTPLSVSELSRCLDLGLSDVSSPDKLIAGIYGTSDQAHISVEQQNSPNRNTVLQAISNLYLHHKVFLELA